MHVPSKASCAITAKMYNAAGGNVSKAAKENGINRNTLHDRVEAAKVRFPKLFKTFPESTGGRAPKPERTLQDEVALHAERTETTGMRAKLKDAAGVILKLQEQLDKLQWAAKMSFEPAKWSLPTHTVKKREHTPVLLTSDFQCGEVVDPKITEQGIGYNSAIFRSRYRRMIDTTIYLSFEHAGKGWVYPGIIYERGGDSISNDIHDELMVTNDMTPLQATQCVYEEEAAGIRKLAEAFGKVDVKTPGAGGNHDRDTPHGKPWTKQVVGRNYDALIAYMLAREFALDKRVTFQTSDGFDVHFPVYGMNHLLTHGDRMGSKGGQGFIGPAATILRGVQKVIAEQAVLGRQVDCVDHGHFHFFMQLPFVNSNGCMPGYSEFAKQWRVRPDDPKQLLRYHHPRRGVVDYKPINLTEA